LRPSDRTAESHEPLEYRLELEGELAEDWAGWFGAAEVTTEAGRTVLLLVVPDQAALHAALRRVHDLNLRLIALTRVNPVDR
jgi:hypothetical protein